LELLERFARGDIGAFEALFREFQGSMYGWIVRIVRDRDVAEELTVEAFWHVYRAHARFDPDGNFAGWARRIATNLALDYLKKARRELPLMVDPADEPGANPALQRELREQITRAFSQLSPKLRVVATLALVESVPYGEIARALGLSETTLRVRMFRATRILREQLRSFRGVEL